MRKIIDGKVYDTDTARHVAKCVNGDDSSPKYCEEDMYCKRTGEYFILGEGGPASRYARWSGKHSVRIGGMKIIPLTLKEAMMWGMRYMDYDDFEEEFSRVGC